MTLEEYFGDWLKIIDVPSLNKVLPYLKDLYSNKECTPEYKDIFKAFTLLKFKDLKVVFLGQDPYPQKGVATGILFGNKEGTSLSPSLDVIIDACKRAYNPDLPAKFDCTMESYGRQGILLLNSALTTEVNNIGAHVMLWRNFISKTLQNCSKMETGLIYVLFGKQAQSFKKFINEKFNHIIEVNHPAYYARNNEDMPSDLFKQIDKILIGMYGETIKWFNN